LLHATTVDPGFVSQDQFLAGYGAAQAVPGRCSRAAFWEGQQRSGRRRGGGLLALPR